MKADITPFFDKRTFTITYVVVEPESRACAIIDSVLDFDAKSGRTSTESADQVIAFARENGLETQWILETHLHADHITAAPYLKDQLGGRTGIGARITVAQQAFAKLFNAGDEFDADGSQFDSLFDDGQRAPFGAGEIEVWQTPGHTPACVCYRIGDAVFVGDTIFMPDFGSARCDFPGGSATQLYESVQRILKLPAETRLFVGHDYGPGGRAYAWETTVAEQRAANKHLRDGVERAEFIGMRETRDAELDMPALLLPAVQVNMRAGHMPPADSNGTVYLKLPINAV